MKEKYKKILKDLGDLTGYTISIGWITTMIYIMGKVAKNGQFIAHENNPIILYSELGLIGSCIIFLLYKLIKGIINRYSLKNRSY